MNPAATEAGPSVSAAVPTAQRAARTGVTAAAAVSPQQLNIAVNGWLDKVQERLTRLGANPLTDFLQGALVLVRRNLFNQTPTAKSYQYALRATGQLVGGVTVVDPEGATPTYQVTTAPQNGTAEIDGDGNWTYTPGPDFVFDSFTVLVDDGGFNIFDPTAGQRSVTVRVGNDPNGPVQAFNRGYKYLVNNTGLALISGYYGPRIQGTYNGIVSGPPDNFVMQQGDTVEYAVERKIFGSDDYDVVMQWISPVSGPRQYLWTVGFRTYPEGPDWPMNYLDCSQSSQPCFVRIDNDRRLYVDWAWLNPPVTV